MHRYPYIIFKSIIRVILGCVKFFIKQKNIIILSSINNYSYKTNTRYLFEYLSRHLTKYDVYYVTESAEVKHYFKDNNLKYLTKKNLIKYLWIAFRVKIVINAGDSYFNVLNLINKDVIKICTMHGNSPKTTLPKDHHERKNQYDDFDYICFNNKYCSELIGINNFGLEAKKLLILGSPQCDQYFNQDRVKEKNNLKAWSRQLNDNFSENSKTILYTPTWRPYLYPNPITNIDNFDWVKFNSFLSKNNFFFYYSFHAINKNSNHDFNGTNIRYINESKEHLYDTNNFLNEVDCLVNDYSNTNTDFSILNRPQIYVMPDYEEYIEKKGFTEDYSTFVSGKNILDFDTLCSSLLRALNTSEYLIQTQQPRKNLLEKYSSIKIEESCRKYKNFIDAL